MVEQVKSFIDADWKQLAKSFPDFNEAKQAALRKVVAQCGTDAEYPVESKDADHENFRYFAICLRNAVSVNPSLNGSRAVRSSVLGWNF